MSINVTVSGNPIHIRRGRVVLSDLDQIKKNERDRRRRLRLEQVRQQSKEISSRLLERARNIAQQELKKLEKDENFELKRFHDRKILEIQQKYQEDLEHIGQAHAAAAVEMQDIASRVDDTEKQKSLAIKRGKEALQYFKKSEKDEPQMMHQQRLQQVRQLEDRRSSMVVELAKKPQTEKKHALSPTQKDKEEESHQKSEKKKKLKRLDSKKLPVKITKISNKITGSPYKLQLQQKASPKQKTKKDDKKLPKTTPTCTDRTCSDVRGSEEKSSDGAIHLTHMHQDDQSPRRSVPSFSTSFTKAQKVAMYNPGDYMQESSDTSSTSSSTLSDDSSYFSDACDQSTCPKTTTHNSSLTDSKVKLYDHNTRQRNIYDRPLNVVEKSDVKNEPNAMEAAREVQRTESMEIRLTEHQRLNAQKRGEDAILRQKVRADYQALLQNLDHLAAEERKLKASQSGNSLANDVHLGELRRKELQKEHQKKLDRAFEAVASTSYCPSHCANLRERIITLAPIQPDEDHDRCPESTWREPGYTGNDVIGIKTTKSKPKEKEISREEQILSMLKKIEKQKRLLLQEFGTSLPDEVYNASIKSLTEPGRPEASQKSESTSQRTSSPPEVIIINLSNDETQNKEVKKPKKKSTSPSVKSEIAIQTSSLQDVGIAEDKGVQVELIKSKSEESIKEDSDQSPPTRYPLEPHITVIRPEVEESSSGSNSSMVADVIINVGDREIKVTPKKRKSKKIRRSTSRTSHKSYSAPSSKMSSPVKRYSKSLPSSCYASPRKINIRLKKAAFNVKADPSLTTKPTKATKAAADVSTTESSSMYSSMNNQDSFSGNPETQRVKRIPVEVLRSKRETVIMREISDTSTSFASLPPTEPMKVEAAINATPILEMLDSSANESRRRSRVEVSPASTPETPSPRTMAIPSNIPHLDRISKILKYSMQPPNREDSTRTQSVSQSDRTRFTDHPRDQCSSPRYTIISSTQPSTSSKFCTCQNPTCKLLHSRLEGVQDDTLKEHPEILKKYEVLQNMCSERIASLTDLIEKVRNEQKGMELSVVSPQDDTSLMQSRPRVENNLRSVQRLVESIEMIHNQLTKTLLESQRIVTEDPKRDKQMHQISQFHYKDSSPKSAVTQTTGLIIQRSPEYLTSDSSKEKSKPKIIKEEKVNMKLNRLKMQNGPSKVTTIISLAHSPEKKSPVQEKNTIEELSKEILEKSKALGKAINTSSGSKQNDSAKETKKYSPKKSGKDEVSPKTEIISQENEKTEDFVPILSGIPKITPVSTAAQRTNGRSKPPVTLQSGLYRTEIDSTGHELSTILEFDTPDTANRSHVNVKSTKYMQYESSPEKFTVKKSVKVQTANSAVIIKPSVHVAPLSIQSSTEKKSPLSSPSSKKTTKDEVAVVLQEAATATASNISRKTKEENKSDCGTKTITEGITDDTKEQISKELQTKQEAAKKTQTNDGQLFAVEKGKISSTSSNSFYELSGISEITSTPSSSILKSSPEEMENVLLNLGLDWAVTLLKKTREAHALSSSSNSDLTPMNTARRNSPTKKPLGEASAYYNLPDFSDVSSISIKEASKSTEQAVLLKGRTSTPKLIQSDSNSEKFQSSNSSGASFQGPSDNLTAPNISLLKTSCNCTGKQLQRP